ncbi:MAG: high-affinity branched-chain amino acid transport protein superfamily, atp bind [Frankiales bacterium]|nr:high-affinity branched-chain amino acid transport protein superfamily, atp bind [Frankiales bacterium]
MKLTFSLALGGIPIGAMYALQALGIVIVYKTSKVFNFASGAIGLACAYFGSTLHAHGIPSLPAVLLTIVLGVAIGVLMELTVRPVKGALTGTIVTLGWLLVLTGGVGWVYGTQVATNEPVRLLSDKQAFDVGGVLVYSYQQLGLLVIAGALAAGLALFFRLSGLGTATRAVSEAPDAARLLGIQVDRVNLVAWGLGGAVSGLAGVLVAPLLGGLNTTALIILTVQALAAALVGRLSSLPMTFAGGVVLGMLQPVVHRALASFSGLKGTDELTAFIVVLVALLFMRRSGRKDVVSGGLVPVPIRALPTGRLAALSFAGVALGALLLPILLGDRGNLSRYNLTQVAVWGTATLSLVLLVGVVGQVSVCQAVFMGCGAYGTGIALAHGLPFLLAGIAGALLAAAVAALVGLPAIRLEPLELAIATLSLSFTADRFLYSWPPLASDDGKREVVRPGFAGVDPGHVAAGNRAYAWLALGVFIVACFAVASLRRGRTGAALTALRSSEPATAAMGFSVVSVKLRGFAASGFLAGLAGALYAGLVQGASGAPFDFTRSITLLAYAVIIGVGSVPGAFFGGLVLTLTTVDFGATSDVANGQVVSLTTLFTGALLIGVLTLSPDGVAGAVGRLRLRRGPATSPAEVFA